MAQLRSYTTIEQSKKLAEILPLESADMEYLSIKENGILIANVPFVKDDSEVEDSAHNHTYGRIACWSFASLLNIINKDFYPDLFHDGEAWNLTITPHDGNEYRHSAWGNESLDACYKMIILLHEQNLI